MDGWLKATWNVILFGANYRKLYRQIFLRFLKQMGNECVHEEEEGKI